MSAIEWSRERRRVRLPIVILAPYPVTHLSGIDGIGLIDTGSSVSGVALRVAGTLGLKKLGKQPLISAQGQGQVERYAFRIGLHEDSIDHQAPSFPFVFEEVIGIELTNAFEFDALIGMDILGQCDFEMQRDGVCRLRFGF